MLNKKLILLTGTFTLIGSVTNVLAFPTLTTTQVTTQSNNIILASSSIEDEAKTFITKLADTGIGFLEKQDISQEEREKEFRKLLQKNFDMKTIGRFALGRYWKTSSKGQQAEYLRLFEEMIISVYSRRFSEYNGQELKVKKARPEGKKDVLVMSSIIQENGPEISIDWRVRKKKDGKLKVIDIMVEGVSMSLTQRSDFASVIQRGGGNVDILLAHLRK